MGWVSGEFWKINLFGACSCLQICCRTFKLFHIGFGGSDRSEIRFVGQASLEDDPMAFGPWSTMLFQTMMPSKWTWNPSSGTDITCPSMHAGPLNTPMNSQLVLIFHSTPPPWKHHKTPHAYAVPRCRKFRVQATGGVQNELSEMLQLRLGLAGSVAAIAANSVLAVRRAAHRGAAQPVVRQRHPRALNWHRVQTVCSGTM